jgi:hypothetical protein
MRLLPQQAIPTYKSSLDRRALAGTCPKSRRHYQAAGSRVYGLRDRTRSIRISWVEQRVPVKASKRFCVLRPVSVSRWRRGGRPKPAGPSSITVVTASSPWTGERSVQ